MSLLGGVNRSLDSEILYFTDPHTVTRATKSNEGDHECTRIDCKRVLQFSLFVPGSLASCQLSYSYPLASLVYFYFKNSTDFFDQLEFFRATNEMNRAVTHCVYLALGVMR